MPFAKKIVDDILVWATDLPTLYNRVRLIAKRCADLNIALSRKKFAVGTELSFAELIFSAEGIKPDPERIVSLSRFPEPKDVTGVRSFLGLANKLSGFVPDFAHMTVRLRELTAKKNAFLWLEEHQKEFEKVKKLLTSEMVVTHFYPSLPVTVLTDTSRLHGLGYALGHYINSRFKLVSCGSKSLTPTQQSYATIELEYLAGYFAIDKCSFYLKGGTHFTLATDHKPLEGIFAKDLYDIPNPRLQRLREKLVEYNFTVTWVPGKSHHIADALSLAPLFSPEETEDMYIDSARAYMTQIPGMEGELNSVLDSIDSDYFKFSHGVLNGTALNPYSQQMKSMSSQLCVDDELVYLNAKRIVLPLKAVKEVLRLAHLPHAGITKTYELRRSLYFWPGMYNDVKQLISACDPCSKNAISLPKIPRSTAPPSAHSGPPMACVRVDLFNFGGKSHLVCVDRWSDYPLFLQLTSTSTASVINTLKTWFNVLGWPRVIRSVGGPQFRGEFSEFCKNFRFSHELPSPYNPRANGLADSGVKIVKSMLHKCLGEGKDMQRVLYEGRNLPKQHSYSPASLCFGEISACCFFQPAGAFSPIDMVEAAAAMDKNFEAAAVHYDRDKVSLPAFCVLIQCDKSKKWDCRGEIIDVRPDGLSYLVNLEGKVIVRGRATLKPVFNECESGQDQDQGQIDQGEEGELISSPDIHSSLRRSKRLQEKKKMVVIACFSSNSEGNAAKLREFQRMQCMYHQQTEDTENTVNQSSGGFPS